MILMITLMFTLTAFADSEIIKVNAENSTVSINLEANNYSELKVLVIKGEEKYTYNLFSQKDELPLQMGNGKYTVGVYQHVEGKKYKAVTIKSFELNTESNNVYLASSQNVKWDSDSATTDLADQLTKNLETDKEKVEAIYNYIVTNIDYDNSKARSVTNRYNPNGDVTLEEGKGICYDYASLTAAMLRSIGIPTKLVKGNSKATRFYHAWNEVLIDDSWVIVDTTTDAAYISNGINVFYIKNTDDYEAEKVY
jgi:transglutaminase-like putative cysteine protease